MKLMALALTAAVASSASAALSGLHVTKNTRTDPGSGVALDVYTVFARFDGAGANDTVTNVGSLQALGGASLSQFYHKDLVSGVGGFGYGIGEATWNPQQIGSATANRPYDSFVCIGSTSSGAASETTADPGWPSLGEETPRFDRGSLPSSNPGWFAPGGSIQGRVNTFGNTFDVRIAQFVVAAGNEFGGIWQLKVSWNPGTSQSITSDFLQFGIPAPGAVALLGLAGLAGRRRR